MTEIREIQIQTLAEPAQVKLIRYAKGYGWEINIHAETGAKAVQEVERIDELFRERYGGEQKPIEELKK